MCSMFNKTLPTDEYLVEILQKKILREDTQIADDKKCQTLVTSKLNFQKEKCGSPWKMQKDSGEEKTSPCFCSLPSICHFFYYCTLRPESQGNLQFFHIPPVFNFWPLPLYQQYYFFISLWKLVLVVGWYQWVGAAGAEINWRVPKRASLLPHHFSGISLIRKGLKKWFPPLKVVVSFYWAREVWVKKLFWSEIIAKGFPGWVSSAPQLWIVSTASIMAFLHHLKLPQIKQ